MAVKMLTYDVAQYYTLLLYLSSRPRDSVRFIRFRDIFVLVNDVFIIVTGCCVVGRRYGPRLC